MGIYATQRIDLIKYRRKMLCNLEYNQILKEKKTM